MADVTQIMLRAQAKERAVRLDIVEKDYTLSYLLAAIAETPYLGDRIALKGGAALKKLYFADYRFSEDLDYSTLTLLDFVQKEPFKLNNIRHQTGV